MTLRRRLEWRYQDRCLRRGLSTLGRPDFGRPCERISEYFELNDWQRRVRREEAYLAQSASLEDLERRMRDLDREDRRPRFIGCF